MGNITQSNLMLFYWIESTVASCTEITMLRFLFMNMILSVSIIRYFTYVSMSLPLEGLSSLLE